MNKINLELDEVEAWWLQNKLDKMKVTKEDLPYIGKIYDRLMEVRLENSKVKE